MLTHPRWMLYFRTNFLFGQAKFALGCIPEEWQVPQRPRHRRGGPLGRVRPRAVPPPLARCPKIETHLPYAFLSLTPDTIMISIKAMGICADYFKTTVRDIATIQIRRRGGNTDGRIRGIAVLWLRWWDWLGWRCWGSDGRRAIWCAGNNGEIDGCIVHQCCIDPVAVAQLIPRPIGTPPDQF
jgi:hypothetical protein